LATWMPSPSTAGTSTNCAKPSNIGGVG
jgi:hypothetical protein